MDPKATFEETGLLPELLKAITDIGFKSPTPIQTEVIPIALQTEMDILGLAQTGTGKTAAFGLPILQLVEPEVKKVQTIILCPTRELARQITSDMESYATYLARIDITPVYGGASISTQIDSLRRGTQIVVGTPGRVTDLIQRGALDLSNVRYVVLDEADEMLNMGFKTDLDFILDATPEFRQTFLFSATMPEEVARIAEEYMDQPLEISVGSHNKTAENIRHEYYLVNHRDRYQALKRIADFNPNIYGIVFCRTRRETQLIADMLIQDGYSADSLHGDLSQSQRDHVMSKFRQKHIQMLVATDIAARGIDVDDITHVLNFNLPDETEVYIHRSGRTARAGQSGISLSLITPKERSKLKALKKRLKGKIEEMRIPGAEEITKRRLTYWAKRVANSETEGEDISGISDVLNGPWKDLSREDLARKVISSEFSWLIKDYRHAPDLNQNAGSDKPDKPKRNVEYKRFYISLGSKNHINPQRLMGLVNEHNGLKGAAIGRIVVMKKFSIFEIDKGLASKVWTMNGGEFRGTQFTIQEAEIDFSDLKEETRGRKKQSNYGPKRGKKKPGGYGDKKKYKKRRY